MDQIVIPQDLQQSILYDGEVNGQRLLIFWAEWGEDLLRNHGRNIAVDGTFKVFVIVSYFYCKNNLIGKSSRLHSTFQRCSYCGQCGRTHRICPFTEQRY